ncbi:MAG: tetratricopeptide repeat protein [Polyangiaceae bacterium]
MANNGDQGADPKGEQPPAPEGAPVQVPRPPAAPRPPVKQAIPGPAATPGTRAKTFLGVAPNAPGSVMAPPEARQTEPGVQAPSPRPGAPVQGSNPPSASAAARAPAQRTIAYQSPITPAAATSPEPRKSEPKRADAAEKTDSPGSTTIPMGPAPTAENEAKRAKGTPAGTPPPPPERDADRTRVVPNDPVAAELLTRATRLAPDDPVGAARALVELGVLIERALGDAEGARDFYEESRALVRLFEPALERLRRLAPPEAEAAATLALVDDAILAAENDRARSDLFGERARLLAALGRPAEARDAFEEALGLSPDHPAALRGLEAVLRREGDRRWIEALAKHLETLADRYAPAEGKTDGDARIAAWLLVERADLLETRLGQADLALASLERAVTFESTPGPVRDALTRHLVRNDRTPALAAALAAEAEREADDARASRLDYAAARLMTEKLDSSEEAIQLLERAASRAPSNTKAAWRALSHLVALLEASGQWEPAASVRQRRLALLTEPDSISFEQVRLSAIFDVIGRADRAALHAARALEYAPEDPSTLERLDRALLRLGRHEDRLHAWAQQANADRPPAVRVAALARAADIADRHLGRRDDALALLRAAWSIDPSNQEVFDALSALLAAKPVTNEGGPVRARIDLYAQAAASAGSPARKLAMLEKVAALWEEEIGDHARAVEALDQVLAIEPTRLSALLAMERNAERAGQLPKLVQALVAEANLADDPALARRLLLRAAEVTSARIGDRDRALALVGKALALDDQDPEALRALARHSERAGRHTEARAALRELVKNAADPRVKFSLWLEIANLDELRRKDADGAVLALQNAAMMKPGHPLPHAEIVRLLRGSGKAEALATALLGLAASAPSAERAADFYFDAAEVMLLSLDRPADALQSLLRAEGLFDAAWYDASTFEMAERILVRGGAVDARAALYHRWLERQPAPAIDHAIRVALAELLAMGSRDQSAAILTDLLRVVPAHVPALRMVEHLHRARGDGRGLAAALRAQAEVLTSRNARCGALWEYVRLTPQITEDEALDALSRIAALDPGDGAALDGILRLSAATRPDAEGVAMRSPAMLLTALAAKRELSQAPVSRALLETERCILLERMGAADPSAQSTALAGYRAALALWPESLLAARGLERLATRESDRAALLESQIALSALVDRADDRARCSVRAAELVLTMGGDGAESRASALYEKALATDPDNEASVIALTRLLAKAPERLVDRFRAAQEGATKDVQIQMLGRAIGDSVMATHTAGERPIDAGVGITAMARALAKTPDDVPALMLMSRLQRAQQLFIDARDTLLHVVEVTADPEACTLAQFALAELYEGPLQRLDLAEASIQAILATDGRNKRALHRLHEIAKARGDRALAIHALACLVEAATHPGERTEVDLRLAEACLEADERQGAIRALCDGVVSSPPDPRPWAALARLFRADTPDGAAGYADALKLLLEIAAQRRLPLDPRWLVTLGLLETTILSRPGDAIVHLQHAVALPGAAPDARALLGRALETACRHVEAIQVLRTLFTIDIETGARVEDVASTLASLEAALAKEGRVDERLAVEEVRACLGFVTADRFAALKARRLPDGAIRPGSLAGQDLIRLLLPEARTPLLDLCASVQPIAAKALRIELSTFGIGSRERIGPRDGHPTRALADRLARALGVESFELYLSPVWQGPPRIYPGDPPAILGATSFADFPEPEQLFVLGRLLVRAALGPTFLDELTAEALDGFLLAALRAVDPGFGAGELSPPRELAAQGLAAHVQRAIGRRQKKQIEELILPALVPSFDVRPFSLAVRRTEYRAALLLCGDLIAGIDHLRRIEAARIPDDPRALLKHPVTSELIRFALQPEQAVERRRIGTLLL